MKFFMIEGSINGDLRDRFIAFVNDNPDEHIHIKINSSGGSYMDSSTIVDIINKDPGRFTVMAQAAGSAAFDLFMFVKCKRELWSYATGMYHYSYSNADIDMRGEFVFPRDRWLWKMYKADWKPKEKKVAKKIMTGKEYKRFKKGGDIYFDPARMREIFPDADVID